MTGSSLKAIVAALGGDLYAGGRRANVPAPGHSAADRSISLVLSGDRVIVHGFGGVDWRAALAELQAWGLTDRTGRLTEGGAAATGSSAAPAAPDLAGRRRTAQALWDAAVPIGPASLSMRHLMRRDAAEGAASLALRHHPAAPLSVYAPGRATRPALIARIDDAEGVLAAVELTYLDPNGRRATGLRLPRKTVGTTPPGAAVRLFPAGSDLLVGEGVFSALSAARRFGAPAWAAGSARALAAWRAPAGVRQLIVASDPDPTGRGAAESLRLRMTAAGLRVRVIFPAGGAPDWNPTEP